MIYLDDLDDLPDEDQADSFTWLDCDDPDCNCHRRRPVETVHLPAEDVTR